MILISKRKEKIKEIIFIRACCCLGIVIFHYFCNTKGEFKFLYITANSSYGIMFVTSFFCISGAVLYYNYPVIVSLKSFYYKRWKSILLPYYICFLFFFLRNVIYFHKLFYKGNWPKIFITIFGLDGYLEKVYRIKTYYIVGEWFLGAIIIIYILYPVLLFIIQKNFIIIPNIIICFSYFLMIKKKFFIIIGMRNIIICFASFYFGIETIRFKNFFLTNKIMFTLSFLILIFLDVVKIKIKFYLLIYQIQGISLYLVLYRIGQYVMGTKYKTIFIEISNLSYSIYLYHHRIIFDILSIYNPTAWYALILLLFIIILLTIICSKIHFMVIDSIIKSYIFKYLDSLFI